MNIQILDGVKQDLVDGFRFDESQQEGLAVRIRPGQKPA